MEELLCSSNGSYDIDFALVSGAYYSSLFDSFSKRCVRSAKSVAFRCDESRIVGGSVVYRKSFGGNLAELIRFLLLKGSSLKELVLSGFEFTPEQAGHFCEALSKSPLERLKIVDLKVSPSFFSAMFGHLNPRNVKEISITRCGIDESSTEHIRTFTTQQKALGQTPCSITIQDKTLPSSGLQKIHSAMEDSPDNLLMEEIAELKRENYRLKYELNELNRIHTLINITDSLFVTGDGSEDFLNQLHSIEQELDDRLQIPLF